MSLPNKAPTNPNTRYSELPSKRCFIIHQGCHFRHQVEPGKALHFLTDFVLAPLLPLSSEEEDDEVEEDAFNDIGMLFLSTPLWTRSEVARRWEGRCSAGLLPMESWLTELMLLLTFWTTSRAKDDLNMEEGEIVVACSSRVNSRISTSGFCKKLRRR